MIDIKKGMRVEEMVPTPSGRVGTVTRSVGGHGGEGWEVKWDDGTITKHAEPCDFADGYALISPAE